jgi:hypothetical protein
MEWNGIEWNGMELNGMEWNRRNCRNEMESTVFFYFGSITEIIQNVVCYRRNII